MRPRPLPLMVLMLALSSCGSGHPEFTPLPSGADPPVACARADAQHVIAISVTGQLLSAPCMVAPAGVAFVVRFTNNSAERSNIAVYRDRAKTKTYLRGEVFGGPDVTKDYHVEPLPAGDYYFEDEPHFEFTYGALYVR